MVSGTRNEALAGPPFALPRIMHPSIPKLGMTWKEHSQEKVVIRLLSALIPAIFPWPTKNT